MIVSDTSVIPGLPKGTKYEDLPEDLQNILFEQSVTTVVLLDLIKVLGLSEKTILIIEQDLRNQNLAELQVHREKQRGKSGKTSQTTQSSESAV